MKSWQIGALSAVSPIPLFIFTILWDWIWSFGICLGILGFERLPTWTVPVGVFPLLISPLLGGFGLVYSLIRHREKLAWPGILCSVCCLIENGLLLAGILYLGTIG